jgi:hypothetical protein
MSKEAVDASLATSRANTAKRQAELEVAKIEEAIAVQEGKINELCSQKSLDYDAILNALDEVALAERRKAQFAKVIGELFPTTTL